MNYSEAVEKTPTRVTYTLIQDYIEDKYNFKVHSAYIAEVKRSLGLTNYEASNKTEDLESPHPPAPEYKVKAIKEALKHFKVI